MIAPSVIKKCLAFCAVVLLALPGHTQTIRSSVLLNREVKQYEKTEFDIELTAPFSNPHDLREITLDLQATSPAGKVVTLPCYFVSGNSERSWWKARFAAQEKGKYKYRFELTVVGKVVHKTKPRSLYAAASPRDGFLHVHDYWTLRFDSGKPFRGIGENVGWESRSFEKDKWSYDYLLPALSRNGANFFRTWMCAWNLPLAWKKVNHTDRYTNSSQYFNESAIARMDKLVALCDSLGLYFMLSMDAHGALIPSAEWKFNNHNQANGGPAATPQDFFTDAESKAMYKNRLRYLVARWGYSPSIAAWEFFNEIDNAVYADHRNAVIAEESITQWHGEMSTFLKANDPYGHIVTTSISHRDIKGLNELPGIDLNQKHIYNKTIQIPGTIKEYAQGYKKPYVIGEFGYDWDWNNVTHDRGPQFDFDYKRGLWYGLFSPTPVLPMTWWWEFFDERAMTPYFKAVRTIHDEMLNAGNGSFEEISIEAAGAEGYSVKCGQTYFVYLLNSSDSIAHPSFTLPVRGKDDSSFAVKRFDTGTLVYTAEKTMQSKEGRLNWGGVTLGSQQELILLLEVSGPEERP